MISISLFSNEFGGIVGMHGSIEFCGIFVDFGREFDS